MTTRQALLDLADRCEAAVGPDRDLDFAIAAAMGWPDSPCAQEHARRYSESIDAALELKPRLWSARVGVEGDKSKERPMTILYSPLYRDECSRIPNRDVEYGSGANSALSACSACLRAHALSMEV